MPLPWIEPQQVQARPDADTWYTTDFAAYAGPPFPATGGYRASVIKYYEGEANPPVAYVIGYYASQAEAEAACQTDWDTYGPNPPPGIP